MIGFQINVLISNRVNDITSFFLGIKSANSIIPILMMETFEHLAGLISWTGQQSSRAFLDNNELEI